MADEPDRDGSDDAGEQPVSSNDETSTGDGDDPERRPAADADAGTDEETGADGKADDEAPDADDGTDESDDGESDDSSEDADADGADTRDSTDDESDGDDDEADGDEADGDNDEADGDEETGVPADESEATRDDAPDDEPEDGESVARDAGGNLQPEPDGQRDGDAAEDEEGSSHDVVDADAAEASDVDAVDLDDVDDASDLTGTTDLNEVDEDTDLNEVDEDTDPNEAGEDTGADETDGPTDADGSNEADAVDDDDSFPVAGMTAEEAAWDPDAPTDPDENGVDAETREDDQIGVQPEKQEISDDFWNDGPESDQEMPLADHIEEMMRRLGVVFLVGGVVTLVVLGAAQAIEGVPTAVDIIDFLWNHNVPGAPEQADRRPRVYGPLELILTKLKVAGLAGLLVGLPVFVYETYLFMRPGLYPRERRYYLAAVPTSLVLGVIGMTFAHFVVLPAIFSYFTSYTVESATVAFGLAETFNLILLLMGYMAVVFQIPLFIMLAIMMNLVTRVWLEDKRLLFWGAFAGLAFLVSPDPTGMAPIIIAATMIVLYEGTLALLRWTGN